MKFFILKNLHQKTSRPVKDPVFPSTVKIEVRLKENNNKKRRINFHM